MSHINISLHKSYVCIKAGEAPLVCSLQTGRQAAVGLNSYYPKSRRASWLGNIRRDTINHPGKFVKDVIGKSKDMTKPAVLLQWITNYMILCVDNDIIH